MIKTEVLIVGAGPTGLTAAAELARLGVNVHIIDKNMARSTNSKALGVQAGTLEALNASFGKAMGDDMVRAGHAVRVANVHVYNAKPIHIDMTSIPSIYNFVLILPQGETERFLEMKFNDLGGDVDRNTELVSLEPRGEQIFAKLRNGGALTEVLADFVIGADGAHSTVRHQLQLPFDGQAYAHDFLLGDVALRWPWEYGAVHAFISNEGFAACFPFSDENKYRVVIAQTKKENGAPSDLALDELAAKVKKFCSPEIDLLSASWLTRFSVSHRVTNRLQYGRIFLAGDAAHIHSPIGGQGMNTGIQDALNLSFKLTQVLQGKAPITNLQNYERERLPIAHQLVRSTDLVTRVGLAHDGLASRLLKKRVLPAVVKNPWVQRLLFKRISQVDVARREMQRRRGI